jgi:hypothetical protein
VTDLRVTQRTVYPLMRGGRARWKIEHETFNTLKNQGDNFEHNDGHGQKNLSVVFAMLMMLAFLVDQTQQRCCTLFQAVWAKMGSKRMLWERMRSLFYEYRLASMRELLEALLYGGKKPKPILARDSSSPQSVPSATAFHSIRRCPLVVRKLRPDHAMIPCATSHLVISDRGNLCT